MPKWSVLRAHTLKPGSYDERHAAWEPAEWPAGATVYILRKADNPDQVIAFGFFEGTRNELEGSPSGPRRRGSTRVRDGAVRRKGGRGRLYEVVEVLGS